MTPLLIAADRLKEFSVISENLDNKLLEPTIINVQELHLYDILGKDLYNEIIDQLDSSTAGSIPPSAMSVANVTLLNDYIEPYLINKVIAESVLDITYKLRNKAIMTTSSDFGQVANLTDLSKIQGKYENIAEGYKRKIHDYLCENGTDYPLYCPKNKESAIGGIYLGKPRKDYRHRYENRPEKDCC